MGEKRQSHKDRRCGILRGGEAGWSQGGGRVKWSHEERQSQGERRGEVRRRSGVRRRGGVKLGGEAES